MLAALLSTDEPSRANSSWFSALRLGFALRSISSLMKSGPPNSSCNLGCCERAIVINLSLASLIKLHKNAFMYHNTFQVLRFKLPILSKNASSQNCSELNFLQKSQGLIYLLPPAVESGCCKDCHVKVNSLLGPMPIISKNVSNKSCSELNFLRKSQQVHTSISPRSVARGLQRLPFLRYYNVLKWGSRFTLGLNAAKITDYIKKLFK